MKKLIILSTIVFALSSSFAETPAATSSGQQTSTKEGEFFKKLDTNGDGALSVDEFKNGLSAQTNSAAVEEYFTKLDSNGDGTVSLMEYTAHKRQSEPAAQTPPRAQATLSSEVPKPSIASEPPRNKELPQNTEMPPNHEQGEPKEHDKRPVKPSAAAEAYFKQMDINDDGGISLIEFKNSPAGRNNPRMAEDYFKNLDTNRDNKLTLSELNLRRERKESDFPNIHPPRSSTALQSPKLKHSGSLKDPASNENRRKRRD